MDIDKAKLERYLDYFKIDFHASHEKAMADSFLSTFNNENLELSVKWVGKDAFPCRMNITQCGNLRSSFFDLRRSWQLFNKMGSVRLNDAPVQLFLQKFAWEKCKAIIYGLDFRPTLQDSRLEFWVYWEDYAEGVRRASQRVSLIRYPGARVWKAQPSHPFLFGFDLFLTGQVRYKAYIPISVSSKGTPRLLGFQGKAEEVLSRCDRILIDKIRGDYMVHMFNTNRRDEYFIRLLSNMSLRGEPFRVNKDLMGWGFFPHVVSAPLSQLRSGRLHEINFYY